MNVEFQKKITPYLDGTLSPEESSEFEAYVATHPEAELQIKNKENELALLKSMIPVIDFSSDIQSALENEMKESVFNLLKEEPKNFMDKIKTNLEDWINR